MTKEELKQYIDDNIYENVDGDISGDSLNEVLKAIVDDSGTKVEANPDGGGKPSILRRIKIDDEIYEAPIGPQGDPGAPGDNAYIHIKYAASMPASDTDMHATPQIGDKYIGVYSGDSSTAPTSYTSYTWSKYVGENGAPGPQGETGPQGEQGDSAYLHIMYSRNMPESDSDISSTFEVGCRYIGICTDNNQTAPSTYESYQWAKFVGNDGGGGGLTTDERAAIVALFKAAVYTTGTGVDDLIDIIENPPITKTVIGLTVSVQSPQPNVYAGQSLDDVKPYLTVTASYDDNTSAVVTVYTLSGDITTTGTKQITASYTENGVTVTDTFDLVVSVAPTLYQVTSNLVNCTSNGSSSVYEHNQYQAVITPNNGYTLTGATVTVTMGGVDISSSYVNGVITITDVTGNITIAVTAAAKVLTGITATLDAQTPNFSVGDSLDVIKPYLTVTAQYSNAPDDTLTDTDYTLSSNDGDTLITGTNTIIVTYQSQTDSVSVTAVAAPVFFDKINLQGGAYIETDIMLPENFSMMLVCDNANTGSTQGYGIIGCSGATSGKFELNRNSWGSNSSKNYYYYGTDNYTGSMQLNTTDYPRWTPWMTPNKYGNGGATKTYTKGAGTPNGVLVVGKTSHANKYQGSFYAYLNGGCIKILGDYAQNAGYEDLVSMAALYTLKPCVYNNEHGLWCLENNKFYGNTASVGTITCSNNE